MDVAIAVELVQLLREPGQRINVLEVGVWKGAWTLALAANADRIGALVGIDPYPGGDHLLQELLINVRTQGLEGTYTHLQSWSDLKGDSRTRSMTFDLVHVDGNHSERGASEDLASSADVLSPGGIIALDDSTNPWFPGVASALHDFLAARQFSMFLQTANKSYLCKSDNHEQMYDIVDETLQRTPLIVEHYPNERKGGPPSYVEEPTVQGRKVLLCLNELNSEIALYGNHSPSRAFMRSLVPPAAVPLMKRAIRIRRT